MGNAASPAKTFRGWAMLVICIVCVFFAAGINSALSVTMGDMAASLGVEVASVGLGFTFGGIGGIVGAILLAPASIKKLGSKKTMIVGSLGVVLGTIGYALSANVYMVWISAFVSGTCGVLTGITVVSGILGNWFIEKRALVIGVALGFATFGSAAVQFISGFIIPTMGFKAFFLVIAACLFVCSFLVNVVFLKEKPEDIGQKALGWESVSQKASESAQKVVTGVSFAEALRSPAFYLLFLGVALVSMTLMGFRGYGPTLLMSYGLSQPEAASYISIVSLFGGVAIMLGGIVAEKLGNRMYLFVMVGGIIAATAIVAIVGEAIAGMPALIVLAMLLAGTASGVSGATPSTISTEAFGTKDYARIVVLFSAAANIGVMLYAIVVAALLGVGFSLAQCFMLYFLPCGIIGLVLFVVGLKIAPAAKQAERLVAAAEAA